MSLYRSAAQSSRIENSTPSLKRASSSPFSSRPKRKPRQRSKLKPESDDDDDDDEEEDFFDDKLDEIGLVKALVTDLSLRGVAHAVAYIRGMMWSRILEQRPGVSSTQIAKVLNYQDSIPPIVTISHVQALLRSPTAVE